MQRHSSDEGISATRNIQLVVRSVSTVGNYDCESLAKSFRSRSLGCRLTLVAASQTPSTTFSTSTEVSRWWCERLVVSCVGRPLREASAERPRS